jgi:negative regulator of replication initiation
MVYLKKEFSNFISILVVMFVLSIPLSFSRAKEIFKADTRSYLKNEKMTCTLPECHVSFDYYDTTKRTL